jgi:hypothetical protein
MNDESLRDPRVGHKLHREKTTEVNEHATIDTFDHFDGSVDKTVKVKALKLSFTDGAAPNKEHVRAIAELQEASKEHMLAKHSKDDAWLRYTTERLRVANIRLLEVQ